MSPKQLSHGTRLPAFCHHEGAAEARFMGTTCTRFLATGEATGGLFCLVEEVAHLGECVPVHRHPTDAESFFVLDGEISFFVDGQPPVLARPGTFFHVPGGTPHGFRIESETARYLILTTAYHGEFYRAITRAARPDGSPPSDKVTGEALGRACTAFGVEYVGPLPDR